MLTILSFFFFLALTAFLTWRIVRKQDIKSRDGFFLAGRSLTFPLIAGSLLLTNLSTEQMVGLNGSAFLYGLSVMVWEVVAVIALVFMGLFFLPRFLKSGVATVPEYLALQFDRSTGILCNLIFLLAYVMILLPIILYTGAAGLSSILNIREIFGFPDDRTVLWATVWMIGIIGSVYALSGGLRTLAVSDTINGIGLLTGGFLILYFGLTSVSGGSASEGMRILMKELPEKFNSIGGNTQEVPFHTIFSGVLLINVFYWCTNQQIIQRTLGASSLAEGQKGVFLTAFLKLIGPLYLVLPGIIAWYFVRNGVLDVGVKANGGVNSDMAYGMLVRHVLPAPLTGFFAAVMVGAILSSFNSALNSSCTLFSLGIYRDFFRKDATDRQIVTAGRIFGWILALSAMGIAPLLANTGSIFNYLQKMNGLYFIPILAVVFTGMVSRRVPAKAANAALISGVAVIACGYFLPPFPLIAAAMQEYHFLGLVFLYSVCGMLVYGAAAPRKEEYLQPDVHAVDMTPWKYSVLTGCLLILAVIVIYVLFADFSILQPQ